MEQPNEPPSRKPKRRNPRIAPPFSIEVCRQSINDDCLKYLGRLPDPFRHEDRSVKTFARNSHPKNPSSPISADNINPIVCRPDSYWYEVVYLSCYTSVLNQEVSSLNLLKILKNPNLFFGHSRPLYSLSNNNPKSSSFFWSSPPSQKAPLVPQSLKKSASYCSFNLQNSLYNHPSYDSEGLGRRRGLHIIFLRRKKVRNRRRSSRKSGENSGEFSPRWGFIRNAAIKVVFQLAKELSWSSISDVIRAVIQFVKVRKGSVKSMIILGATDSFDGDWGLFWANWRFPLMQESEWSSVNNNGKGDFGVPKICGLPELCLARSMDKEELSKCGGRVRVYGCNGEWKGVECGSFCPLFSLIERGQVGILMD